MLAARRVVAAFFVGRVLRVAAVFFVVLERDTVEVFFFFFDVFFAVAFEADFLLVTLVLLPFLVVVDLPALVVFFLLAFFLVAFFLVTFFFEGAFVFLL